MAPGVGRDMGAGSAVRMRPVRIVVTGGHGQLGRWLRARAAGSQVVEVHALGRAELDVTSPASVAAALERLQPDVVVNAAAYTAVDAAESDPDTAWAINATGAHIVGQLCGERQCPLVHISTDYVPGVHGVPDAPGAATEFEPLAALPPEQIAVPAAGVWSVYAATKHAGELAVRRAYPQATVVRTAWLYTGPGRAQLGAAGSDFVATMLRLAQTHAQITVVDDQVGSPTYAADLAAGILTLAARLGAGDAIPGGSAEVLHAAGAGTATWHELAQRVFVLAGLDPQRVVPISTAEFGRPAPRPRYSVLADTQWRAAGLQPLPHWHDGLRRALLAAR